VRDSDGKESEELTQKLTNGLRDFYRHIIRWDTKGVEDYLVDRLIETMILRHKRILYRRARQEKWAMPQQTVESPTPPRKSQKGKWKAKTVRIIDSENCGCGCP
jgi:hypothetical protein